MRTINPAFDKLSSCTSTDSSSEVDPSSSEPSESQGRLRCPQATCLVNLRRTHRALALTNLKTSPTDTCAEMCSQNARAASVFVCANLSIRACVREGDKLRLGPYPKANTCNTYEFLSRAHFGWKVRAGQQLRHARCHTLRARVKREALKQMLQRTDLQFSSEN